MHVFVLVCARPPSPRKPNKLELLNLQVDAFVYLAQTKWAGAGRGGGGQLFGSTAEFAEANASMGHVRKTALA